MSERKLATIQVIESIHPIEGADKIETARVLGWECVVKKSEFKEGEKIIYVEVDSVMPEKPEFEFLRSRNFRIKTIKLKGQISQGLVLPIGEYLSKYYDVGTDVTNLLGVTKYLSPSEREEFIQQERRIKNEKNKLNKFMMRYSWWRKMFLTKNKKTKWPYWVGKTDEERIQNIPHILEQFKDKEVYATEKIDCQSVTFTGKMIPKFNWLGKYSPKKYQFVVCSRNLTTNDKNSLYWKIATKYNIEKILRENPHLTIQGEQGDTKVQGNKYKLKEPRFWIFNIIDHEKKYHYDWKEMYNFCKKYNLEVVPLLDTLHEGVNWKCKLGELGTTVKDFIELSKGKSLFADIPREGIVIRCIENGKKLISFKAINPDFLLKFE